MSDYLFDLILFLLLFVLIDLLPYYVNEGTSFRLNQEVEQVSVFV